MCVKNFSNGKTRNSSDDDSDPEYQPLSNEEEEEIESSDGRTQTKKTQGSVRNGTSWKAEVKRGNERVLNTTRGDEKNAGYDYKKINKRFVASSDEDQPKAGANDHLEKPEHIDDDDDDDGDDETQMSKQINPKEHVELIAIGTQIKQFCQLQFANICSFIYLFICLNPCFLNTPVQYCIRSGRKIAATVVSIEYYLVIQYNDEHNVPSEKKSVSTNSPKLKYNQDWDRRKWYNAIQLKDKVEYLESSNETRSEQWWTATVLDKYRVFTVRYTLRNESQSDQISERTFMDEAFCPSAFLTHPMQFVFLPPKDIDDNIQFTNKQTNISLIDKLWIVHDADRKYEQKIQTLEEKASRQTVTQNIKKIGALDNRQNKKRKGWAESDSEEEQVEEEGEEEVYGESESEEAESEEMGSEDDFEQHRESSLTSYVTTAEEEHKIESILYTMDLPEETRLMADTFQHCLEHNKENMSKRSNGEGCDGPDGEKLGTKEDYKMVTKYLIKYFDKSYHHCEWLTKEEILKIGAEHTRLIKRVRHAMETKHFDNIHFFNPLYLQIDRIIDVCAPNEELKKPRRSKAGLSYYEIRSKSASVNWVIRLNQSNETLYLVKWTNIQYDEATWEAESFLCSREFEKFNGEKEIELFRKRQALPIPKHFNYGIRTSVTKYVNRPKTWEELTPKSTFKNGHELRSYQISGVNWLVHNWLGRRSCILADEMGLGKTIQMVVFLNQLATKFDINGPFLIVAPLSTLGHWSREFKNWSDLNVVVYHGTQLSRERLYELEFFYDYRFLTKKERDCYDVQNERDLNAKVNQTNCKFDVLITTAQVINSDKKRLNWDKIKWQCIIVDEAHCLKSRSVLLYKNLVTFKHPQIHQFQTHVVLMTGTPIQNNVKELFSLLHFLDPKEFASEQLFLLSFPPDKLHECQKELKQCLQPRLLQRYKSLVEKNLQNREEKIVWVELTFFQKKWYRALYEKSYDQLRKLGSKSSLLNVSIQLRKCCNHPFLLPDVEETISPEGISQTVLWENLIKASGKLVLLDKLLPKLQLEGRRVLIFSQMTRLLDIIEDFLVYRQYQYERLDGGVTGASRQEAIDRFTVNNDIFAFLLSTRAGGVGINLMAADTVIIYDSDWNPMNDIQAIARAHRIGQTKQVNVYRLVTRNTYEEGKTTQKYKRTRDTSPCLLHSITNFYFLGFFLF
ncbi:Chromodomain helicase-DNA-binding protein [Reticulomyxa filosa]|uniref:Chromodomain helicase-DNA-binding protein n=1 Tax=Reticulomyxa filosa TaxID=46433 RepID=X6NCP7_RETFI|nr:Chromodomain helicase-DNA-binding protein [Reticulomyxa filosa]|eukprot:ETO23539.1 Chromodomain helicase-DNA-binding protein [Reticulomyxa filosa]